MRWFSDAIAEEPVSCASWVAAFSAGSVLLRRIFMGTGTCAAGIGLGGCALIGIVGAWLGPFAWEDRSAVLLVASVATIAPPLWAAALARRGGCFAWKRSLLVSTLLVVGLSALASAGGGGPWLQVTWPACVGAMFVAVVESDLSVWTIIAGTVAIGAISKATEFFLNPGALRRETLFAVGFWLFAGVYAAIARRGNSLTKSIRPCEDR
jgi:hypothetical protein